MEFQKVITRFRHNSGVVDKAQKDVTEYARLLKRHPQHHCNVAACAKVTSLAVELSRDADADKANPEKVAEDLRALPRGSTDRIHLREYKKALDVCMRDCREETALNSLAEKLQRNVDDDLLDSTSVRHLLEDVRSMRQTMKRTNSEAGYNDRNRWKALKKTLKIFGWQSPG